MISSHIDRLCRDSLHKRKPWFVTDIIYVKMIPQISFGPISWLMVSEIFPLRTRGRGISLAVLTNFGSNAIVTFAFSPLKVWVTFNFFICQLLISHATFFAKIRYFCRSCLEQIIFSFYLEVLLFCPSYL